ncbi:VOC family protein [Azospirillum sp. TSO22-1]|uniref:VOC family protein n=1 Tax=Azospirillum sp. TSO22-1 TaxID=716789 RepID=UPI000D61D3E4|nr:VOC family protein [Azospirillum sp. TSO22-1]PWC43552.1 hypothetical protein TSO221_19550 [Azospirillum sp. TSO22-1]
MTDAPPLLELAIRTRDHDACLAFYRLLLGPEIRSLSSTYEDGQPVRMAWFALGDGARLVLADSPFRRPATPQTAIVFLIHSPEPEAVEARLRAAGVWLESGTHTTGAGNRVFIVHDPDGNELSVGTRGDLPPA